MWCKHIDRGDAPSKGTTFNIFDYAASELPPSLFPVPQSHSATPNDDINSRAPAQIQANYYLDSVLANRPTISLQPLCTCTSQPFSQFLALPGEEVPIQFLVECGVLNGPISVASNPLSASSVLGASASSRTQSASLLNGINSACLGTLTQEAGNRIVQ